MKLKAIDCHAHLSTIEGIKSMFKYQKGLMEYYLKKKVSDDDVFAMAKTDEAMAQDFIDAGVKGILVGWDAETTTGMPPVPIDYLAKVVREYPEAYIGAYACVDPWKGEWALAEAERAIKELGLMGLKFQQAAQAFFPNDRRFYPFWEKCCEWGVSVQFHTGTTGLGANMPGGAGVKLKYTRPIPYLDDVAADFPELKIIACHPSWPWQEETIAMAIHKPNVFIDLSGWSPIYFQESLKREIKSRLKDRVLYGTDYPLISHERLFSDYQKEGYPPEILERVYYKNAIKILDLDLDVSDFE